MIFDTEIFSRRVFLLGPAAVLLGVCALIWYLLLQAGTAVIRRGSVRTALPVFGLLMAVSLSAVQGPTLSARFASQFFAEASYSLADRAGIEPAAGTDAAVETASAAETASGADGGANPAAEQAPYAFPGIEDADIHLFIAESYGMTVFTNRHHRRRLEAFYGGAEQSLEEAGYSILSWAYESTAFGGTSWLADAALITGLDIDTQAKYDRVIDEGTRNLLHILAEAGYRRVLSAPGTKFMDDRYRRFYDFSRYLMFEDFEYEGPYFAYGRMPDQYQLARAAEEIFDPDGSGLGDAAARPGEAERLGDIAVPGRAGRPGAAGRPAVPQIDPVQAAMSEQLGESRSGEQPAEAGSDGESRFGEQPAEAGSGGESRSGEQPAEGGSDGDYSSAVQPLFVEYLLCSSHVPWNYIPPYRPSWEFPDRGRVYYDRSRNTYYENSWAAGSELFAGYAHSIRYSLRTVFGFIRRYLDDGEIAIVIGDHQPKFPVSEKGASFAVPIHVISTEESRIGAFKRFGYVEGLRPPAEASFPGLELFLGHFLSAAGGGYRSAGIPEELSE
jgi:hypothetical protein